MSIRLKLALILSFALAAATAASMSVSLLVEDRALRAADEEKIRVLMNSVQAMASEAQLARDPLMLIDYLSFLERVNPQILSARARFNGTLHGATGFRPLMKGDSARVESVETRAAKGFPSVGAEVSFSRFRLDERLRAARAVLIRKLVKGTVLLLSFGLLSSVALSWTLTSRLLAVERVLGRIGEGRLDISLPENGSDEVARLARGINTMVAHLRELDEMKRRFTASVTHELRSPLFAIESYARLLLKESRTLTPEERGHVERIRENAGRLAHFVTSLLDLARIERGQLEYRPRPMELGPLVENVVLFLGARAREEEKSLTSDLEPGLPSLTADPDLIGQVLTNMVSNAIKFTPRGGRVRVTLARGADSIECAVEDSGVGIPPEDLGRLFKPFERIKNTLKVTGTGLGLSIAKSIIDMHGGRIGATSEPGRGSRFYFRLPVGPDNAAPEA